MTELPALEKALRAAARRRYGVLGSRAVRGARRRPLGRAVAPIVGVAAVIGAIATVAIVGGGGRTVDERSAAVPAPQPATDAFARQRGLLGVLRDRLQRDDDPQVADQVRDWQHYRPRREYARLLGKAPSGSAFVLVPVRQYDVMINWRPGQGPKMARDGLCLMRRGTQGGAGICGSIDDLRSGRLWGALAGQVYGVVPDGVIAVRPVPGAQLVPVRRNFYVYDDPRERGPIPPPAWCYDTGRCVPTRP